VYRTNQPPKRDDRGAFTAYEQQLIARLPNPYPRLSLVRTYGPTVMPSIAFVAYAAYRADLVAAYTAYLLLLAVVVTYLSRARAVSAHLASILAKYRLRIAALENEVAELRATGSPPRQPGTVSAGDDERSVR
jgi:hypothetical protein